MTPEEVKALGWVASRLLAAGDQLIGHHFRFLLTGRKARAEARAAVTLAEGEARVRLIKEQSKLDVKKIKSGTAELRDGALTPIIGPDPTGDLSAPNDRLLLSQLSIDAARERFERILPIADIIGRAIEDNRLPLSSEDASETVPSAEWLRAFGDGAARTPDDESLRKLWARLLSSEVKNPGKNSRRTMQTLELLEPHEVQKFALLGPLHILQGHLIANRHVDVERILFSPIRSKVRSAFFGTDHITNAGVTYNDLLHLESIGLLEGVTGSLQVTLEFMDTPGESPIWTIPLSRNRHLVVSNAKYDKSVPFPTVKLTAVGLQLIELGNFIDDQAALDQIVNALELYEPTEIFIRNLHSDNTWTDEAVLRSPQTAT